VTTFVCNYAFYCIKRKKIAKEIKRKKEKHTCPPGHMQKE
jgi:hypothetical protein